jgi:hypothetical protein
VSRDFTDFEPHLYLGYETMTEAGPAPYSPLDGVSGPAFELSAGTPTFRNFDARMNARAGRVPIFAEGSEGDARAISGSVALRPSDDVRIALATTYQRITRAIDGSEFARTTLPRVRAEYQPTRSFFVRAVAEYRAERRSALRDARTGAPLRPASGSATSDPTAAIAANGLRLDLLLSYQPVPGTVAFLGYGASYEDRDSFSFDPLMRTSDGLFIKLAYQLRR